MRTKDPHKIKLIQDFIHEYMITNRCSPTIIEIAKGTGISKSNVDRYIKSMEEDGIISGYSSGRRCMRLTKDEPLVSEELVSIPMYGYISCGNPIMTTQEEEGYINVPSFLLDGKNYFFLRANGESMTGAGINDGDLILVRKQSEARSGDIVVALVEDEVTLKKFYPGRIKGKIVLHPENEDFDDIIVESCVIQGVVKKVIKDV